MIVKLYQKNGSQQRIKEPIIKPKKKMSSFIFFENVPIQTEKSKKICER